MAVQPSTTLSTGASLVANGVDAPIEWRSVGLVPVTPAQDVYAAIGAVAGVLSGAPWREAEATQAPGRHSAVPRTSELLYPGSSTPSEVPELYLLPLRPRESLQPRSDIAGTSSAHSSTQLHRRDRGAEPAGASGKRPTSPFDSATPDHITNPRTAQRPTPSPVRIIRRVHPRRCNPRVHAPQTTKG